MNGATEHTLAELLRVAQEQNANMEKLTELLSGRSRSGGSGGGGLADMAKNIPLVSTAFSVVGAAVSAVGSVFEMLGNVVGKMVDGVGSAIKGLWSFSQKAMEGTARMSDLFDAFGKLPFFLGELFQIGGGLLRVLEKLTDQYIEMSKVGAGFTGGIMEMRFAAQSLAIGFNDLMVMTSKNSQALAEAGGTVSSGFKKFVSGMDQLMGPNSQFRNSMFALGVNSKEAGEYMMTVMKLQQTQVRNGQMDAAALGRQTKDYIENLDQLTRLTGVHRDQVNELIKKQADDQIFENFLSAMSPEKAGEIRNLLAMSTLKMGKEYTENVLKPQLMGIEGPINESASKIAVATQGASVAMGARLLSIQNSTMSAQEKMKQTFLVFGEIAKSGKATVDMLGGLAGREGMPNIEAEMLKFALAMKNGGEEAYNAMMAEQKTAERSKGLNVELMNAQEKMIRFGNDLTIALAGIAERWGPTLIRVGTLILDTLLHSFQELGNWIQRHTPLFEKIWTMAVGIFDEYILPKLSKIGQWFSDTWDQLVVAWGDEGPKGIITVLKDRLADGMNNIWEDMQKIWKTVSPYLTAIWNNDVKPVIIKLWNELFAAMMNKIKDFVFGEKPDTSTPEGKSRQKELDDLDARNQRNMPWYEKANQQILNLNDQLFSWWDKDLGQRVKNARIARQTEIIDDRLGTTVHGRASGGMVNPGTYLVGEKGPELLSVGASGNVITNENLQKLLNRLAGESDNNYIASALEELNNTMRRIENYSASTTDHTRRTVGAIAQITGDIMPTI